MDTNNFTKVPTKPSSRIESIEYNEKDSQMIITFKNSKRYLYKGVNKDLLNKLLTANSLGKAFQKYIALSGIDYDRL